MTGQSESIDQVVVWLPNGDEVAASSGLLVSADHPFTMICRELKADVMLAELPESTNMRRMVILLNKTEMMRGSSCGYRIFTMSSFAKGLRLEVHSGRSLNTGQSIFTTPIGVYRRGFSPSSYGDVALSYLFLDGVSKLLIVLYTWNVGSDIFGRFLRRERTPFFVLREDGLFFSNL
ncbi:hypothetical protein ACLOJK_024073 [Asimina triloba]